MTDLERALGIAVDDWPAFWYEVGILHVLSRGQYNPALAVAARWDHQGSEIRKLGEVALCMGLGV